MTNYSNPIIERELITTLRKPRSLAMQLAPAVVLALLILMRWPTDSQVGLSGLRALDVFRLFAYGLLGTILLLVPAFPAMSIVREKKQGTLALLLNSPLSGHAIYLGKLFGSLGFVFLPLIISLPAAAACYAMGGISLTGDLLALYVVLSLATIQYTTLALLVSTVTANTDSAGNVRAVCRAVPVRPGVVPRTDIDGQRVDALPVPDSGGDGDSRTTRSGRSGIDFCVGYAAQVL